MYKFNSENEYQLWCQNKINSIYYANIAMNSEKIKDAVQEIARTLHCSEGEQLVKPTPILFIIEYSVGEYDDYSQHHHPMKWLGTKDDLDAVLRETYAIWKKKYKRVAWNDAKYNEKLRAVDIESMIECDDTNFCASSLHDTYCNGIKHLKIYRLDEWIEACN